MNTISDLKKNRAVRPDGASKPDEHPARSAGGAPLWLRRLGWLVTIWLVSILVLGVVAYGMRQLMSAAGMTARPEAVSVWEGELPNLAAVSLISARMV